MGASSIHSAPRLTDGRRSARHRSADRRRRKTGTGSAQPVVGREFTSGMVTSYIELYADAADMLKNTTVMFEVAKDEQARALDGAAGRVQPATADSPNRRTLEGSIPLALLPPGDYVARAVVSTDGRKVGQVTRPFPRRKDGRQSQPSRSLESARERSRPGRPTFPWQRARNASSAPRSSRRRWSASSLRRLNVGREASQTRNRSSNTHARAASTTPSSR